MTFDGLTLAAMAAELRDQLIDARVQKVVQPDPLTIALEMYGNHERHWLLLSAEPQRPRVYLTDGKPGRGVEIPSPLLLLLRKHVEGLRLGAIVQPSGERILSFEFVGFRSEDWEATASASAEERPAPRVLYRLIIEAISQYSNLILVDDHGIVLDAVRRVSAEQNRYRVTLPHHPYAAPPAQTKRSIESITAEDCRAALLATGAGTAVWQALVSGFSGLGPLAVREISFRGLGDARARIPGELGALDEAASRLATALAAVVQPVLDGELDPSVARDGDAIVAFAPYCLTHLGHWESCSSLSVAAEAYYGQGQSVRAVDIARRALKAAIEADRSLANRKRESLLRALEGTGRAEEFRQRGDLLFTYGTMVPKGATSYFADGVTIDLDPRLSAIENAQSYFRRYQKAKAALREVPALLEETELRLRYLDEIATMADLAETADAVRALRAEIRPEATRSTQQLKRRRPPRVESGVLRLRAADGTEMLVGRSARQNHEVTFELARPEDVWLHARGCPGAHVVLRVNGGTPSRRTLEEAAAVAAYFSSNRTAGRVTVDWTRRKLVRRLGNGTPGLVSYSGEQSLVVRPEMRASEPARR